MAMIFPPLKFILRSVRIGRHAHYLYQNRNAPLNFRKMSLQQSFDYHSSNTTSAAFGISTLEQMKTSSVRGETEKVLQLLREVMNNSEMKIEHLNVALEALENNSQHNEVARLFDQVINVQGIRPNNHTFSVYIKALSKNKQVSDALDAFGSMQDFGLKPDPQNFFQAILACEQDGRAQDGLALLEDMVSLGYKLGVRPCTIVLSTWANRPEISLETIEALFQEMIRLGLKPNYVTHNVMIDAIRSKGSLQQALSYIKKVEATKNFKLDEYTYSGLLKNCQEEKDFERARKILQMMTEHGINPTVHSYTQAINACHDNVEEAMEIFQEMTQNGVNPNIYTYNTLLHCCVQGGKPTVALGLFETMVNSFSGELDQRSYVQAIKAANELGDPYEALKILKYMQQQGVEMNRFIYSSYLRTLAKIPECTAKEIKQLFEEMEKKGIELDSHIFAAGIGAYCQVHGGFDLAVELYERKKEKKIKLTQLGYEVCLKAFVSDGVLVEKIYQDYIDAGHEPTPSVLSSLLVARCKEGDLDKVLNLLDTARSFKFMTSSAKKIHIYDTVLSALVSEGFYERAESFVSNRYPEEGLPPSICSITNLMKSLTAQGKGEQAIKEFEKAMLYEIQPDGIALSGAINACRSQKDWKKALEIFETYSSKVKKEADYYSTLIITLDEQNQHELARKYYRKAIENNIYPAFVSLGVHYLDLHGMPITVAKIAVRDIFQKLLTGAQRKEEISKIQSLGGLFFVVGTSDNLERSIKTEVIKMIECEFDVKVKPRIGNNEGVIAVVPEELQKLI